MLIIQVAFRLKLYHYTSGGREKSLLDRNAAPAVSKVYEITRLRQLRVITLGYEQARPALHIAVTVLPDFNLHYRLFTSWSTLTPWRSSQ